MLRLGPTGTLGCLGTGHFHGVCDLLASFALPPPLFSCAGVRVPGVKAQRLASTVRFVYVLEH